MKKRTPYCPSDVEALLDDFAREHVDALDALDTRPSDWQTNPDYYTDAYAEADLFEELFDFNHSDFGDH